MADVIDHHQQSTLASAASSSSSHKRSHSTAAEENAAKRQRTRVEKTKPSDHFTGELPKDILLMMTNDFLDDDSAKALGRTSWTHVKSMKGYRIKRPLSLTETLRVLDTAERAAVKSQAGHPTPPEQIHPHAHLDWHDTPVEAMMAKELGDPSTAAFRGRFAFGRPQLTHLALTRDDLSKEAQTEDEFLAKIARLPPTLTQVTLDDTVLDVTAEDVDMWFTMTPNVLLDADNRDPGHLDALCRNWPASLTSIVFEEYTGLQEHPILPLHQWRLPPGLTGLYIPLEAQHHLNAEDGDPVFYTLKDDLTLPPTLAALDAGEFYDRDLNLGPLTDKPPPRSPAEQAKARAKRLA
jgi:hypothetical protein